MTDRESHPEALRNLRRAHVPESKVRYPLRDPNKRRTFEALGFSEKAGNWGDLRDAIEKNLRLYPAHFSHRDEWGITFDVDMILSGPEDTQAPVRTKWIYRTGEDFPRLVTIYVKTTQWKRRERERDL